MTAFQLYADYRQDISAIEATFEQVGHSHVPTIAAALWSTNRAEAQVAVDGLARLPDVRHVVVMEDGKKWVETEQAQGADSKSREYPLTYSHRGQSVVIGSLIVAVDLGAVYQRLLNKFWLILATNTVKTFLVAGFMLWLFHRLVTRHLLKIAEFTSRLSTDNLHEPLALARPARLNAAPDEFDLVAQGIARMQANLEQSVDSLRQSEARFRVLFEQAAVGVAQMRCDTGAFVRTNQKYCEIVGYTPEELAQLDFRTMTPPQDYQAGLEHVRALEEGRINAFSIDQRYFRKDGSRVWINLTASPMWQSGEKPDFYIAVVQDISARKKAEADLERLNAELEQRVADRTGQLAATNRELEAFSYSVAHDLRAPLRSIDGFSQALIDDCGAALDVVGHDHLNRVRRAAQRMGVVIDAMSGLAGLVRKDMMRADVDLSELASEIMAEIQTNSSGEIIEFSAEPGLIAYADRALLSIVLENLLSNAVKYSSKVERPRIEFGRVKRPGHPAYVVRDNGAGFNMAYVNKLFGAFQRLHREDEFSGTGVGLATVKRIIQRHGGEVWAEGKVGVGASFYFTLEAK